MNRNWIVPVIWIATACARTSAVAADDKPRCLALLVGVTEYEHISSLRYCDADMRALRSTLLRCSPGRVTETVTLHELFKGVRAKPTKRNIERELIMLCKSSAENDALIFAFSGHGLLIDGKGHLCPRDLIPNRSTSFVSLDFVFQAMVSAEARVKICIIDACRREAESEDGQLPEASEMDFVQSLDSVPSGIVVLNACGVGEVSIESDQLRRGVFSHFLVTGLRGEADHDGDDKVTVSEAFRFAAYKTRAYTRTNTDTVQMPTLRGEFGPEALDYVLTRTSQQNAPGTLAGTQPTPVSLPTRPNPTVDAKPRPELASHLVAQASDPQTLNRMGPLVKQKYSYSRLKEIGALDYGTNGELILAEVMRRLGAEMAAFEIGVLQVDLKVLGPTLVELGYLSR